MIIQFISPSGNTDCSLPDDLFQELFEWIEEISTQTIHPELRAGILAGDVTVELTEKTKEIVRDVVFSWKILSYVTIPARLYAIPPDWYTVPENKIRFGGNSSSEGEPIPESMNEIFSSTFQNLISFNLRGTPFEGFSYIPPMPQTTGARLNWTDAQEEEPF